MATFFSAFGSRTVEETISSILSSRSGITHERDSSNIIIETKYGIDSILYIKVKNPMTGENWLLPPDNYEIQSGKKIKVKSILGDDLQLNRQYAESGLEISYMTKISIFSPEYFKTQTSKRFRVY